MSCVRWTLSSSGLDGCQAFLLVVLVFRVPEATIRYLLSGGECTKPRAPPTKGLLGEKGVGDIKYATSTATPYVQNIDTGRGILEDIHSTCFL